MSHFAKLDENNVVIEMVVVNNDVLMENGVEVEQKGIDFLVSLFGPSVWKQTSYNGRIRKNYAGIGYSYFPAYDAFVPPQPYPSWLLNTEIFQWQPQIAKPVDGKMYDWNEETQQWVENTGV